MDKNYHYHTQEIEEVYASRRDIYADQYQADYDYHGELPEDCDPADCRRMERKAVLFA